MTVIPNSQCETYYNCMSDEQLCVSTYGRKFPCKGDSGGPLLQKINYGKEIKLQLIGVASGGSLSSCQNSRPVVYTRFTSYLKWIQDNSGVFYY